MNPTAVSLFDESGNMLQPWAEAGVDCHCLDLKGQPRTVSLGKGTITFHKLDVTSRECLQLLDSLNPIFLFGFPPCTDVAISGAKHFEKKMREDPSIMVKAAELAQFVPAYGNRYKAIWAWENPKSMLKHYFGSPDYKFDPYEFGGYLPEDDQHPRWPEFIPPRDAYPKETWIWASKSFIFPEKKPVYCPPGWSPQTTKLGGKSAKTKQIRSETPRGFAKAVFEFNFARSLQYAGY